MLKSILAFYCLITVVSANVSLDSICTAMTQQGVLSSDFTQTKTIKGIPMPLTSTGTLTVDSSHGIVWQTKTPFPATLLLSKSGIFQVENGKRKNLVKGQHQDKGVMAILSKLLQGQFNRITEFNVAVKEGSTSEKWSLNLIALGGIAKIIKTIDIQGDSYVRQITVFRVNGDKDQIVLRNHQLDPKLPNSISSLLRG
ncbi:MAG: outer membrane lipoprotein carrier protein LolA [Candidatus Paracaedibacteraceae bacterium]|nr:outer membrane lipoprotein carrier protein LolA [Candidatus Paracaedibacteraceae bacterium]